ncbi:hypothetical protein T492DRAFT_1104117 [Pavlovales sp. CCMP2436]|nr:hypothetical protein T492DRAFT_1104117 [Pavlovales sp. CCMP2436]
MTEAPRSAFSVGGGEVQAFNDGHFARLRDKHKVHPSFLEKFDIGSLRLFGGKGGNPMAFTADKRYLVKEINTGDHGSMLKHTLAIVEHQLTANSLICPIFLHFELSRKTYVVMRNVLPSGTGVIWHKKYDLKGNRDDKLLEEDGSDVVEVHKRCFHLHTCWYGCDAIPFLTTVARKRYYEGKKHAFETQFVTSDVQAAQIIAMINGDTQVFSAVGVMDYSLVVGILRQGEHEPIPPADGLNQFVISYGGWTYIYYMGIIDFLQEWTSTKKIAALIKAPLAPKPLSTVPPVQYAQQFAVAFQQKFGGEKAAIVRI